MFDRSQKTREFLARANSSAFRIGAAQPHHDVEPAQLRRCQPVNHADLALEVVAVNRARDDSFGNGQPQSRFRTAVVNCRYDEALTSYPAIRFENPEILPGVDSMRFEGWEPVGGQWASLRQSGLIYHLPRRSRELSAKRSVWLCLWPVWLGSPRARRGFSCAPEIRACVCGARLTVDRFFSSPAPLVS